MHVDPRRGAGLPLQAAERARAEQSATRGNLEAP